MPSKLLTNDQLESIRSSLRQAVRMSTRYTTEVRTLEQVVRDEYPDLGGVQINTAFSILGLPPKLQLSCVHAIRRLLED